MPLACQPRLGALHHAHVTGRGASPASTAARSGAAAIIDGGSLTPSAAHDKRPGGADAGGSAGTAGRRFQEWSAIIRAPSRHVEGGAWGCSLGVRAGVTLGATPSATHPASPVITRRRPASGRGPRTPRCHAEIRATDRDSLKRTVTGETGPKGTFNQGVLGSIPRRLTKSSGGLGDQALPSARVRPAVCSPMSPN